MQQQQPTITQGPADELPGFGDYASIIRKRKRLLFMVGLPILALADCSRSVCPISSVPRA